MDTWATKYLQEWREDFHDEPDLEQELSFQHDLLESLKRLSDGMASAQSAATSIAATLEAQDDHEESVELFQAILLAAGESAPLDPATLAEVTLSFVEQNPAIAQKFRRDLACNLRHRWNGPEMQGDEAEQTQSVNRWIGLNTFVAHLTRLDACPLEDYALMTFNHAFGNALHFRGSHDSHIPAAAAWIRVLGKEIFRWSCQNHDVSAVQGSGTALFNRDKWASWKQGFEDATRSEELEERTRSAAELAWSEMVDLETRS